MTSPGRSQIGVRVRPNANLFITDLRKDLSNKRYTFQVDVGARMTQANKDIRQWANTSLKGVGARVGVAADTTWATRDMQKWRDIQRGKKTNVRIGVNLAEANAEMLAWRKAVSKNIDIKVKITGSSGQDLSRKLSKEFEQSPIKVRADTTELRKDIEKRSGVMKVNIKAQVAELDKVKANIDAFVQEKRGVEFSLNISDADKARFNAEADKLTGKKREAKVGVKVEGKAKAETEIDAVAKRKRDIKFDADVDLKKAKAQLAVLRAEQLRRRLDIPVHLQGIRQGQREVEVLRRQLGTLGTARINVGPFSIGKSSGILGSLGSATALASAMPAAITGVTGLAQALTQLGSAAFIIPGALGAIAASVATIGVGFQGVGDAFSAMFDVWNEGSDKLQTQAKQVANAQNSLRNAAVDEALAQKQVGDARKDSLRSLRDLNSELRSSTLNEAQAILDVQKARDEQARGGAKTRTDQLQLDLNVAKAEDNLGSVRERNARLQQDTNEANAKGVDGADNVVAALEASTRATQALATAQQQVANTDAAGATSKFNDALALLSPNARAFVESLSGLKGPLHDFKNDIQDIVTSGLDKRVLSAFDNLEPSIRTGMGKIAQGLNQNILTLFDNVDSPDGRGIIDRILLGTADSQAAVTKLITPLVQGIGTLVAAGAEKMPQLIDLFTTLATRFQNFITAADQDGRLDKWIDNGIKALSNLVDIGINLGQIIVDLSNAFGGDLLTTIKNVTGDLHKFLSGGEGQTKLAGIIADAREEFAQWKPILEEIPGIFGAAADGARGFLDIVLPALNLLADVLGGDTELVSNLVTAFLLFRTIKPVFDLVSGAVQGIGTVLEGVGTKFAATRARAEGEMARTALAFEVAGGGSSKLKGAAGLTNKIGLLAGAIAGPAGLAIAIGATLIPSLLDMNEGHDEAAEHAKKLLEIEKELASTINDVTGAITAQTRLKIAEEFEQASAGFGPNTPEGKSVKDALKASTALGIDQTQLVSAAAGDEAAKANIEGQLKQRLSGESVLNKLAGELASKNKDKGVSKEQILDLLIRAQLGDGQATDTLNAMQLSVGRGSKFTYDQAKADQLAGQLSEPGRQSVLIDRSLRDISEGRSKASANIGARGKAAFGTPTLSEHGQAVFGAYDPEVLSHDGVNYEVHLRKSGLTEKDVAKFKANGNSVYAATKPDTGWYVKLADDNVNTDVKKGYKKGGFTDWPASIGRAATLHGHEFVQPEPAVSHYGVDAMTRLSNRQIPKSALKGFQGGGDGDPNDPANWPKDPTTGQPISPGTPASNPYQGGVGSAIQAGIAGLQNLTQNVTQPAHGGDRGGSIGAGAAAIGDPVGAGAGAVGTNAYDTNIGSTPGVGTNATWTIPGLGIKIPVGGQQVNPNFSPFGPPASWDPKNPIASLPDKIQPATIGQQFGEAILQGVLGFFGLDGVLQSPYVQGATALTQHYIDSAYGDGQGSGVDATNTDVNSLLNTYANTPGLPPYPGVPGAATGAPGTQGNAAALPAGLAPGPKNPITVDTSDPRSTKLKYLIGLAQQSGLTPSAGPSDQQLADSLGLPSHDDDGKLHTKDEALDIGATGNMAQANALAQWWVSDPARVASTDELIFDGPGWNTGLNIKNGKFVKDMKGFTWGNGVLEQHNNHVHLALGGVPAGALQGLDANGKLPSAVSPTITPKTKPLGTPTSSKGPQGQFLITPGGPLNPHPGGGSPNIPVALSMPITSSAPADSAAAPSYSMTPATAGSTSTRVVVIPGQESAATRNPYASSVTKRKAAAKLLISSSTTPGSPGTAVPTGASTPSGPVGVDSSPQEIAKYIYSRGLQAGLNPMESLALVAYSVGESGLNPKISGGKQGDDEVIGLFQEKTAFSGGLSREQRMDPVNNVNAYLAQLSRHRGTGDIMDQLLATSVGGPMHTGGRAYMASLMARAKGYLGFKVGGFSPWGRNTGMPVELHGQEFVQPQPAVSHYGVEAMENIRQMRVPKSLLSRKNGGLIPSFYTGGLYQGAVVPPPQPIPPPPPPAAPKPVEGAQIAPPIAGPDPRLTPALPPHVAPTELVPGSDPMAPPAPPQTTAPEAPTTTPAVIPPGPGPGQATASHLHPAIQKGIASAASTLGKLGDMALAAGTMGLGAAGTALAGVGGGLGGGGGGGGGGGLSISGIAQQAGKIATDVANVGASFLVGNVTGGTTPNAYGVTQRSSNPTGGTVIDRSSHQHGDIYTNDLDEYFRRKGVQEAQQAQASVGGYDRYA